MRWDVHVASAFFIGVNFLLALAIAYYQTFIAFKKQRLTNTINFKKLGITQSSTVEDLKLKGYSDSDAEKIIAYFRTRQSATS